MIEGEEFRFFFIVVDGVVSFVFFESFVWFGILFDLIGSEMIFVVFGWILINIWRIYGFILCGW